MDESLVIMLLIIGLVWLWFMALLVKGVWIEKYIRTHGERPAPFNLVLPLRGMLEDYNHAKHLAKEQGHTPWFIRAFELLIGIATLRVVAALAYVLVSTPRVN